MGGSKNPYVIRGGPKLLPSVVAFVDILGYKELVENSSKKGDAEELLRKLHRALKESNEHVNPRYSNVFHNDLKKDFSAFRAFTDNIVIGHPIQEGSLGEAELGEVFRELSRFQMGLAMEGFFVRGGISIGDLYMDDAAVFGPALIEAYNAERMLARDPRIVLADSARSAVRDHLEYYAVPEHAQHVQDIREDADSQYFVHYLNAVISGGGYFTEDDLGTHKATIEDKLKQHERDPVKWSKYMWIANYHNDFCDISPKARAHMRVDIGKFRVPIRVIT